MTTFQNSLNIEVEQNLRSKKFCSLQITELYSRNDKS